MTEHATPSAIVPLRGLPGVAHSEDTKARCFVLYATAAARNCADVERLIAEELDGTSEVVPTRQAIAGWARDEQWAEQADDVWRNTKRWGKREPEVIALSNAMLGQQRRHEVLMGKYNLADRTIERVLPLGAMEGPPEPAIETKDVPREAGEAQAKSAMIQRGKTG